MCWLARSTSTVRGRKKEEEDEEEEEEEEKERAAPQRTPMVPNTGDLWLCLTPRIYFYPGPLYGGPRVIARQVERRQKK